MAISYSPSELTSTVAAAVRAEMARRRVSQRELAERLGCSQPKISRRLNATLPFTIDELDAVAGILRVQPESLLRTPRADRERAA